MKAFCTLALGAIAVMTLVGALPAAAEDMEAIKIELPEPFFGGTPIDYWSENLEPEDFKDRAPFMAPKGTALVSKGKPVTASDKNPSLGELKMIVDGDVDHLPEQAFYMVGGIDEAIKKAEEMGVKQAA